MRYAPHSILAATDLGAGSDVIVRSAARLAARAGAELHLVHALDIPWITTDETLWREGMDGRVEAADKEMGAQVERVLPDDVRPTSRYISISVAHQAILDRADETSADLIVVGPHRGGAVGAHFLGTTADRVIRTSAVPCLVVDKPVSDPVRRIGVPIDIADPSPGALETALAWALQWRGDAEDAGAPEIRVMHVGWTVEKVDDPEMEERTIRPELRQQVERAVARVPGSEALDLRIDVLWANDPTEATLGWVDSEAIDLLVMGTSGRAGWKRALIGSMASRIARRTPCPVLLMPPAR